MNFKLCQISVQIINKWKIDLMIQVELVNEKNISLKKNLKCRNTALLGTEIDRFLMTI